MIFWMCAPLAMCNREIPTSQRSQKAVGKVRPELTRALKAIDAKWGDPVYIRIFKKESKLELWLGGQDGYRLFRTYDVCYYSGELGPKLAEGDGQAPEGFYRVTPDLLNPWSSFHLSFNIGFPNAYDRGLGRTGSYIMVHGNCVSTGCFAMTDPKIEEIYALVEAALKNGQNATPVHIFPFYMTQANLDRARNSSWRSFWENLREGYLFFERARTPPKVTVVNLKYHFSD